MVNLLSPYITAAATRFDLSPALHSACDEYIDILVNIMIMNKLVKQ